MPQNVDQWASEQALPIMRRPRIDFLQPMGQLQLPPTLSTERITLDKWLSVCPDPLFPVYKK